jgi:hypothetical protein
MTGDRVADPGQVRVSDYEDVADLLDTYVAQQKEAS